VIRTKNKRIKTKTGVTSRRIKNKEKIATINLNISTLIEGR
jgi:hypothetical protein